MYGRSAVYLFNFAGESVILADAPMGVQLPPSVAPDRSPKYSGTAIAPASTPICADMAIEIEPSTGIMVATYGILSINAEITTDAQTITVYIKNRFPPPALTSSCANQSITPCAEIPPIIKNKPTSKRMV